MNAKKCKSLRNFVKAHYGNPRLVQYDKKHVKTVMVATGGLNQDGTQVMVPSPRHVVSSTPGCPRNIYQTMKKIHRQVG